MDIPTECVQFYVLTSHSAGVETKCIIEELSSVFGANKISHPTTIYHWTTVGESLYVRGSLLLNDLYAFCIL